MLVIVEGPDGAGKTTLARAISAQLDLEYRRNPHISSTHGAVTEASADWADEQIRVDDWSGVYDRFFYISEPIYQLVSLRPLNVDSKRIIRGIIDLANIEPIIVFCLPPWEVSREVIRAQPEKLVSTSLAQLEKVHWAYSAAYSHWSNAIYGNVLTRDFTTTPDNHDLVQHELRERLGGARKRRA